MRNKKVITIWILFFDPQACPAILQARGWRPESAQGPSFFNTFLTKSCLRKFRIAGLRHNAARKNRLLEIVKILSYSDPFSSNDVVWCQENKIYLKKPQKFAFGRLQLRENISKTTNRNYIVCFVYIRQRMHLPGTCIRCTLGCHTFS